MKRKKHKKKCACDSCRMKATCPAKGERCNDYVKDE